MSKFLTLRCLSKSLQCSSLPKNIILKYKINPIPASQNYVTNTNVSPTNSAGPSDDEWRTIYHLPLIRLASAFNRVKVPFGIMNAVIVPAAFVLEQSSQLPPSTAMLISAVGLTSWCTLAISSLFVRNLIGFVYINDNNDKLKLAYVDYWGKRNDVYVNLDDVIPEVEKSRYDFYQLLSLYSNNTVKYKLLPRFGKIEDPETFAAIFGE